MNLTSFFQYCDRTAVALKPVSRGANLFKEWQAGCGSLADTALHPTAFAGKVIRDASDFASLPDKSLGPQKVFTLAEVAALDGRDGRHLCLVICGSVYDVTDFADFHPGGPDPLKKYAGQDATVAFRASGMPEQVYEVFLKRFLVGKLVEAEFSVSASACV
ncbi:hypothetical protein ABMA28_003661 [Loxostege sticticalis]|uniref:Cytochrome b5 heme-binding domain-containing protein n=1 Tax=Loxostege sticticalis TaxID=481309 RepID=A0ABD0SWR4_LOXSC